MRETQEGGQTTAQFWGSWTKDQRVPEPEPELLTGGVPCVQAWLSSWRRVKALMTPDRAIWGFRSVTCPQVKRGASQEHGCVCSHCLGRLRGRRRVG